MGGEYSGSMVYLVEHAPLNRRGFFGSFVLFGTYIGFLIGSGVGYLVEHLSAGTSVMKWSWRIPFLFGSIIGAVGWYMRQRMPETPYFENLEHKHKVISMPLRYIFKNHCLTLFKALGIMLLPAVSSYLTFVYFPNYLTIYAHISLEKSLLISTFTTIVVLFSIPLIGWLSDYLGQKFFVILSALLFIVLSYFLYQLFSIGLLWQLFFAQALFSIMVCMCESVAPALLSNLFPTNQSVYFLFIFILNKSLLSS